MKRLQNESKIVKQYCRNIVQYCQQYCNTSTIQVCSIVLTPKFASFGGGSVSLKARQEYAEKCMYSMTYFGEECAINLDGTVLILSRSRAWHAFWQCFVTVPSPHPTKNGHFPVHSRGFHRLAIHSQQKNRR